jgi:hypothetical protein
LFNDLDAKFSDATRIELRAVGGAVQGPIGVGCGVTAIT